MQIEEPKSSFEVDVRARASLAQARCAVDMSHTALVLVFLPRHAAHAAYVETGRGREDGDAGCASAWPNADGPYAGDAQDHCADGGAQDLWRTTSCQPAGTAQRHMPSAGHTGSGRAL